MRILSLIFICLCSTFVLSAQKETKTIESITKGAEVKSGFFDFYWNSSDGNVYLKIKKDQLNKDFLYVSSLSAGVGSNDIGLDRGQLGGRHVVFFSIKFSFLIWENFEVRNVETPWIREGKYLDLRLKCG